MAVKRFELWDGIGELAYWVMPAARGHRVAARAVTAVSNDDTLVVAQTFSLLER